ncbi:MAG: 3-hydroxybutyryl-CoA dehydrogenase [Dehalococcoidales bacterium]|nr:3-hydroxybutyryl-CoA dehydrogenase [Dehalococcoidales bacterium]
MEIKKVGVVGCGLMGSGIAQVCAQAGYQVVVSEANEELLKKGLGSIDSFLANSVKKGRVTQEDKDALISRIKGTIDFKDFADCNLVIEAVVENIDLKKKIFAQLDEICPDDAILASNTSCLSVIDIANATSRPEKVLGLHFFNPVPLMKLLEIVKSIATSDETIEAGKEFGKAVGKTTIIAPDIPGFIVNRLLMPFMHGALRMLESGYATKEDIDTGVKLGLGHPMGPITLADLIGLDTDLFIANAIYDELKETQYAPPTILKKMVAAGWWGRKTGKGFYDYNKK